MRIVQFDELPSTTIQWYDSRLFCPPTTGVEKYLAILDRGWIVMDVVYWEPCDNYTNGHWKDLENNKFVDTYPVLYWAPLKFKYPTCVGDTIVP